MKHISISTLFFILILVFYADQLNAQMATAENPTLARTWRNDAFEENKGQVKDQFGQSRPDVLFSGENRNLIYHIRDHGISYQLVHFKESREKPVIPVVQLGEELAGIETRDHNDIYRIDINWLNADSGCAITTGKALAGYSNYYNVPDGIVPALNVGKFEDITFSNIWEGVDLRYFVREGILETEWLMQNPDDYKKIQFAVTGADLSLTENGFLIMRTPFGDIHEGKLRVFQGDSELKSEWRIDGNIVSFNIPVYQKNLPLCIDPPVQVSGTYYGGTSNEEIWGASIHSSGNLSITGRTQSLNLIATVGSHHAVLAGNYDVFLVTFNANGVRKWGTYYGGANEDWSAGCAIDTSGNIFVVGITASTTSIVTPGAHQIAYGGGNYDAFLAKFDSNGVRQWGTYYGGTDLDYGYDCKVDSNGMVFISGQTGSSGAIATSGTHQPVYLGYLDAFLVKFNTNGVRQWGTYFGGDQSENAECLDINTAGKIIITGFTRSENHIATQGAHQVQYGGYLTALHADGFVAQFNGNGILEWGTYYGGPGAEWPISCFFDTYGDIYICGTTNSDIAIATPTAHQAIRGGNDDGFLVKFSSTGVRQWGTYIGGTNADYAGKGIYLSDNIYIPGITYSGNGIATAGTWQPVHGGGNADAFMAKYTLSGTKEWGTYFGSRSDETNAVACAGNNGLFYLMGGTKSVSGIATGGSHQTIHGGLIDAYVAGFIECADFIAVQPQPQNGVLGGLVVFSVTPSNLTAGYQWQTDTGSGFMNISDTGQYSGTTTGNLTISGLLPGNHLQPFRCLVTMPACAIHSQPATIQVTNIGVIEPGNSKALIVFPNPATNTLRIIMPSDGQEVNIYMANLMGQLVLKKTLSQESTTIDVGKLPRGIYLIMAESDNGIQMKATRIVLE